MKDLMIYLEEQLSEYAPVYFEDIIREEDGSIKIDSINIVYDLPSIGASNNLVKREIPLILDIWHMRMQLFDVEYIIEKIDKKLSDTITTLESGSILKIIKDPIFYLNIRDPDPNIRRKRLQFVIYYYKSI